MKSKRGMTQETLVKMILGLVLLAILLYLAYTYILKGGEGAAKLGDCESKPNQICQAKDSPCSGQKIKYGCPETKPYCCVQETQ
ncbi:MAG: hypothetical protein AABY13_00645 [Nanoarchaeota archaeon]